jgi:hypothetical protein
MFAAERHPLLSGRRGVGASAIPRRPAASTLSALEALLGSKVPPPVAVTTLVGPSGCGKTLLSVHAAAQFASAYGAGRVLFLDCTQGEAFRLAACVPAADHIPFVTVDDPRQVMDLRFPGADLVFVNSPQQLLDQTPEDCGRFMTRLAGAAAERLAHVVVIAEESRLGGPWSGGRAGLSADRIVRTWDAAADPTPDDAVTVHVQAVKGVGWPCRLTLRS